MFKRRAGLPSSPPARCAWAESRGLGPHGARRRLPGAVEHAQEGLHDLRVELACPAHRRSSARAASPSPCGRRGRSSSPRRSRPRRGSSPRSDLGASRARVAAAVGALVVGEDQRGCREPGAAEDPRADPGCFFICATPRRSAAPASAGSRRARRSCRCRAARRPRGCARLARASPSSRAISSL